MDTEIRNETNEVIEMQEVRKYKKSGIVIACYVLAAAMLIYGIYTAAGTVKQINEYYGSYGMTATAGEYISYVLQSMLEPLLHAITLFMAGFILSNVRKLNPDNYVDVILAAEAALPSEVAEDKLEEKSEEKPKAKPRKKKEEEKSDDKAEEKSEDKPKKARKPRAKKQDKKEQEVKEAAEDVVEEAKEAAEEKADE